MGKITSSIERHLGQVSMNPNHVKSGTNEPDASPAVLENIRDLVNFDEKASGQIIEAEAGVSGIEATTAVWGTKGKWIVIAG